MRDKNNLIYSIKSGTKWQILLYSYNRIKNSKHLNVLKCCLDSFPEYNDQFKNDRIKCIGFKEDFIKIHGKNKAKELSNEKLGSLIGSNSYINAKKSLSVATPKVCSVLENKENLKNFLSEAIFNINEVDFLSIKENTNNKIVFHVFSKELVLNVLCKNLTPKISNAGRVVQDYNEPGQKTLLQYRKRNGVMKNIIELEVRTDSKSKYRSIRFNMYSKDTLVLLLNSDSVVSKIPAGDKVIFYNAEGDLNLKSDKSLFSKLRKYLFKYFSN